MRLLLVIIGVFMLQACGMYQLKHVSKEDTTESAWQKAPDDRPPPPR